MKENNSHSNELYTGSIPKKMFLFAIPLFLTGILQLLYNAADMIVVGRFAGTAALSAVGATSQLINLFINLFTGLALGASVVASRYFGANDDEGLSQTVHTSIALSVVAGIFITIIGCTLARPILVLMETPADVLDGAVLYIRIFFSGMVFNMVYTYGAAVLRAIGDTKRPLLFLTIAGIVNVILNLIFVIVFKLGVAGVGLATISSQAISMVLVIRYLMKINGAARFSFKKLAFHKDKFAMLLKFGLPAGIQSSLFAFSNVIVQSSINIFGTAAVAGNTAATNIDGFMMIVSLSFNQANIAFVSQNIGAKQYSRVRKSFFTASAMGLAFIVTLSSFAILFSTQLISLYTNDPEVIAYGIERLMFNATFQFFCMFMNVFGGQMQALGHAVLAMIISLCGGCMLRIVWIYTIFTMFPTLRNLYVSYAASWGITALVHFIFIMYFFRKFPKEDCPLPNRV
ncbi:MAG: MATE family efflux transporter [Clostridia bacterium]